MPSAHCFDREDRERNLQNVVPPLQSTLIAGVFFTP